MTPPHPQVGKRSLPFTTIGAKLLLSFAFLMVITLLIALSGFVNDASLSSTVERIAFSTSVKQSLAGEIDLKLAELISLERGMNLRSLMKDRATADAYNRDFLSNADRLITLAQTLDPLLATDEDKQLCTEVRALVLQLRHLHDQSYLQIGDGTPELSYKLYRQEFLPLANRGKSLADRLLEDQIGLTHRESIGARETERRARWITGFMLVLFCISGAALSRIVVGINRSLRRIAANLGNGAAQIASAAMQVASSSNMLAHGASEQAASIEETATSAEEINSMAHRNAGNAQATAGMVAESQRHILEGNRSLDQMVAAVDGIALSSARISKIVKLIDHIAFQTNILAINAAVEAARAGEAGLSFAVVAEEVRNLSQRSAQAAKDTAALIEECIAKSQAGKLKVDEVAQAIRSITAESAKVRTLIDEIHLGSQEQSRGIEQVSKAVLQMEHLTQGTAAAAEASAAAAEELNAQFETIQEIADDLATMVGASGLRLSSPVRREIRTAASPFLAPHGEAFPLDAEHAEEEFQPF